MKFTTVLTVIVTLLSLLAFFLGVAVLMVSSKEVIGFAVGGGISILAGLGSLTALCIYLDSKS